MLERRFHGLVAKIHGGECVLVLGPRVPIACPHGGSTLALDDYLSSRLLEDLGVQGTCDRRTAVARYERERNASACRSFVEQIVSELDDCVTTLHRNLASLPFRLVLSATPDRIMGNAFRAAGKHDVQEACYDYCRSLAAESMLSAPTSARPIVYSLFGRHDLPESMVLNDKNLLDYLVRIIRESPPLPDAVRATLRAPSTVFLFVGFGFTNWWLRLLLKVLEVIGVENRALSLALEDASSLDSPLSAESRAFFESAGIFIQTRDDWSSLAAQLADDFRTSMPPKAAATPPGSAWRSTTGPRVFLSYASDDAATAQVVRERLEQRGIAVWLDKQQLRGGQNWRYQIERVVSSVDYFVFLQSETMDARDALRQDGVYNWELKEALARQSTRPYGSTFVVHVTHGRCRERPEPELRALHRLPCDSDDQLENLARALLANHRSLRDTSEAWPAVEAR